MITRWHCCLLAVPTQGFDDEPYRTALALGELLKTSHGAFPRAARVSLPAASYWPENSPPQRRWTALLREFAPTAGNSTSLPRWRTSPWASVSCPPIWQARLPAAKRPVHRADPAGAVPAARQLAPGPIAGPVLFRRHVRTPGPPDAAAGRRDRHRPRPAILAAGYMLARLRGVPLIVEMRDAWPDLARDARLVRRRARASSKSRWTSSSTVADLVVAVTKGAETLRSRGSATCKHREQRPAP